MERVLGETRKKVRYQLWRQPLTVHTDVRKDVKADVAVILAG